MPVTPPLNTPLAYIDNYYQQEHSVKITHGQFCSFSPCRGDTFHRFLPKFGTSKETENPLCHAKFHVDWSIYGYFWHKKLWKILNFANLMDIHEIYKFYAPMIMFHIWCHSVHKWGSYGQKNTIGQFSGPLTIGQIRKHQGVKKMGHTSSMCVQSLVETGGHMATGDKRQWHYLYVCMSRWMSRKEVRTFNSV